MRLCWQLLGGVDKFVRGVRFGSTFHEYHLVIQCYRSSKVCVTAALFSDIVGLQKAYYRVRVLRRF